MDKNKIIFISLISPIVFLGIVNLLTVFTPEIGFDALWYHLTLPKLWLLKQQWYFEGGLLYYSVMPRLSETLFIPLVKFSGFIGPKLVQFASGILVCYLIWKILRHLKINKVYRLVAISLFYCTWLVSWQSGSAYIDLIRTSLETTALYFFVTGSWKKGGVFLGLAIGTKWIALVSLLIYSLVFFPLAIIPALVVALPWFLIAYFFTGNPIFPIFGPFIQNSFLPVNQMLNNLVFAPFIVTKPFDDFISPLVGLIFIFTIVAAVRIRSIRKIALVGIIGAASSLVLDPPSSRFLLPYLPALIISSVYCFATIFDNYRKYLIAATFISSLIIISARTLAIRKYIPYLLGAQSLNEFLTVHSARLPGTFIDSDDFVAKKIPDGSKILIDNLHNLYYFPKNFDHTSWAPSEQDYDYLVTISADPAKVNGELLNTNQVGIQVFKINR